MEGKICLQPKDLDYFFVEKTDIFKTADPLHLSYIKECYPTLTTASMVKYHAH